MLVNNEQKEIINQKPKTNPASLLASRHYSTLITILLTHSICFSSLSLVSSGTKRRDDGCDRSCGCCGVVRVAGPWTAGVSYFGEDILVGLGQDPELSRMAGRYILYSVPTMWGSGFSTVMCTWLQAQGIFAPVVALGLPGLAVQVLGLHYLLPRWGYLGATAATAVGSVVRSPRPETGPPLLSTSPDNPPHSPPPRPPGVVVSCVPSQCGGVMSSDCLLFVPTKSKCPP